MCARPPIAPHRSALLEARARHMRHAMTPSESKLWLRLKGGQLGVRFVRQAVLGGRYVADFFAPARGVIVEVDGTHHERQRSADARRDRVLARLGYQVVHIEAALVHRSPEEAVSLIRAALGH